MRVHGLPLAILATLLGCTKTRSSEAEVEPAPPPASPTSPAPEAEVAPEVARVDAAGLERLIPVTLTGTLERAWSSASTWGGERRLLKLDGPRPVRVVLDLRELDELPEPGTPVALRGSFGAARPWVEDQLRDAEAGEGQGQGEAIAVVGVLRDPRVVELGDEALDAHGLGQALREHPVRVRGQLGRSGRMLVVELGQGRKLAVRVVAEVADEFDALVGTQVELEGALRIDPEIGGDAELVAGLFLAQPKVI